MSAQAPLYSLSAPSPDRAIRLQLMQLLLQRLELHEQPFDRVLRSLEPHRLLGLSDVAALLHHP